MQITLCSTVMYINLSHSVLKPSKDSSLLSLLIRCIWLWASTLLVSCRSSKSIWCFASPEEHNHHKIYERKEWKSRKVSQCFTCGPGKPNFPGGPSVPCGERKGWEIAVCWDSIFPAFWVDGEDVQLAIFWCTGYNFYTIKCYFMVTTLVSAQLDFVNVYISTRKFQ